MFDQVMIEVVAIEMRERLGFEPWEVFAARARVKLRAYRRDIAPWERDPDRASGRSTRETLQALARCQVHGIGTLHVVGDRHDFRRVQDLVNRLRLSVSVVCGNEASCRGTPGGFLVYQDHHAAETERRRRS